MNKVLPNPNVPPKRRDPFEIALSKSDELRHAYREYAEISRELRAFENGRMVSFVDNKGLERLRPASRHDAILAMDIKRLKRALAILEKQAFGETVEREADALFCLIPAAIPSAQKLDAEGYLDAMMAMLRRQDPWEGYDHDAHGRIYRGGFTTPVISAALHQIIDEVKFIPAVSEVFVILRRERGVLQGATEHARRLLEENGERVAGTWGPANRLGRMAPAAVPLARPPDPQPICQRVDDEPALIGSEYADEPAEDWN